MLLRFFEDLADDVDARISAAPHSRVMAAWAARVAFALGLSKDSAWRAMTAARVHDIGKLAVPEEILRSPRALTDEEWEIIKGHPGEGRRLLEEVPELRGVGLIVGQHHERFDGKGYPFGIAGDDIAIEARVVSVCDAWAAMRAERPYRSTLDVDAARHEVIIGAAHQFDPGVAEAFLHLQAAGEVGEMPERSDAAGLRTA